MPIAGKHHTRQESCIPASATSRKSAALRKICAFGLLTVFLSLVDPPCKANVSAPPAPPAPPTGYCSTIYTELQGYLDAFNQKLGTPASYPTLQAPQLQMADSNSGPAISGPNYLASVMVEAQELQAMGFQAVKVEVAFPVLYEPFFGSQSALQPYLNFYQQLAQNLRQMGMKIVVENNVLLSTGTEAGWTNVGAYYDTLSWSQFIAGRAAMAATVAQLMQPDYLMLAEEPDNEAVNAGQPNLNNPSMAAAMIAGEITAARAVSPSAKLGAGFGTWMGPYPPNGLTDYLNAYVALPLDYIDFHIYPINTEYGGLSNFLDNALIVANGAAAASKPVAMSESWPWKMENAEFNVDSPDLFRARGPFSFWAPLDSYFIQTMANLANYTQMLYSTAEGSTYFQAYQTYGGTTANGGGANCTCTTASCSEGGIVATENSLAETAARTASFTTTGFFNNSLLVTPPDVVPPSAPVSLSGTIGYTSTTLSWTGSTDNVGVAGYNVYRCTKPPCTPVWIANSAATSYVDSGLTDNTTYDYRVQAFDMANNTSAMSNTISLTTALNTPPNAPTNIVATAVSPKQIDISWSAPQSGSGLGSYLIYAGTSPSSLVQIMVLPPTSTSYQNQPLSPATAYYYGVVAVEQGLDSPMSPIASATTLPLPNPPSKVMATPASSTRITLTWQETIPPGGLPIANYQIYQGTAPGALSKIATVLSPSFNSTSLNPGTTYYFEIVAVDTGYDSSMPSDPVAATTVPSPAAPTNVQATTPAATKINLTWQWAVAPGGLPIARFNVYCGASTSNQPEIGTVAGNDFLYTSASPATRYYCYVVAVDTDNDNSPPSANVPVVTPPLPNAPAAVQATASGSTKVTVTWSENLPPGGLAISVYQIYRSTKLPVTIANYVASRTTASYIDTAVSPSTTYYYAVSAVDTGQDTSPLSNPAQVTTP
jgi:fibronectin type 3 domain-containing protein